MWLEHGAWGWVVKGGEPRTKAGLGRGAAVRHLEDFGQWGIKERTGARKKGAEFRLVL